MGTRANPALATGVVLVPASLLVSAVTLGTIQRRTSVFDAFTDWRWLVAFDIALVGSGAHPVTTLPDFWTTSLVLAAALGIVAMV